MKKNINRYMKYVKAVAMSAPLLLAVPSCDVNDLQPATAFSEVTAFSTADRVSLAVIGAYNAAQSGFYAGGQVRGYPFGAANVQQSEMRGEDMINQALFFAITYESTHTAFSANNDFHWQTLFSLVNQSNIVMEGVRNSVSGGLITEAVGRAFEGEMRFLRALAYHELLIHFARPYADNRGNNPGVPYREFAINSPSTVQQGIAQGRNTVAECYTKLLADLDFAETNLPETRAGVLRVTRATKAAAIALKTRVKLHMQDYAGVIAEGNKLVSMAAPFVSPFGGYQLTATPEGPFTNRSSSEALFSIENNDVDNPGVNGALAAMYGNPQKGGRGLIRVSPIIFNNEFWLANDLRRNLTENDGRSFYTNKFRDYVARTDFNPIIRYAEVLLNVSEAIARTSSGVDARALALLNAVRNRAVTNAADQYTAARFANNTAFISAILAERRIELMAEGRRWADIHRLALDPNHNVGGIPAKVRFGDENFASYNAVTRPDVQRRIAAIPYTDNRFLWPIPASETNQNPTLAAQQNPGY